MTNFIPIFPLGIIVFPQETLNLHIFEPRYKELVGECLAQHKMFGIPSMIDEKVNEYGTLVEILRLDREYENGELDIVTRGLRVFRILEIIREVPDRQYSGAIVNYPDHEEIGNPQLMQTVIQGIRQLHQIMKISKEFSKPEEQLNTYDIGHLAGLSLQEEYEFLMLLNELHRQEYLKRHLSKTLPLVADIEHLRDRVQLNGHFRNLSIENF